jgi:hypothetical protein
MRTLLLRDHEVMLGGWVKKDERGQTCDRAKPKVTGG